MVRIIHFATAAIASNKKCAATHGVTRVGRWSKTRRCAICFRHYETNLEAVTMLLKQPAVVLLPPLLLLIIKTAAGQEVVEPQQDASDFVAQSQSNLTLELLSELSDRNGNDRNVVFSPSSIFYGMSMLYAGMGGSTKETVGQAMNFPQDEELFNAVMKVSVFIML